MALESEKDKMDSSGWIVLDSEQLFAEKICLDIEESLRK
jgi:hypothetical protein